VFEGGLSLRRGNLTALGKTFSLESASLTFPGGDDTDPIIDLVAIQKGADVTARVALAGKMSSPTLSLSSQPELPQDEVLARLLFAKSAGALSPIEIVQLTNAAAELAGYGGSGVIEALRRTMGVDRLAIVGDPSAGPAGAGVAAGRYVTEGVYVGVQQGLGADTSKAKVEVDLTDNLKLESEVGSNAQTGLGLNWQWDY
jgi:translocation and assembly module TamB